MLVATVLHDPDLTVFKTFTTMATWQPFTDCFQVILSNDTPDKPYKLLLGDKVIVQQTYGLANARREALRSFLDSDQKYLLLADFDRLLYWLAHDMPSFVRLSNADYDGLGAVFIGRSERAMLTHPEPQRSTERAIPRIPLLH